MNYKCGPSAYNENNNEVLNIKAIPMFMCWAEGSSVGFELALKELDVVPRNCPRNISPKTASACFAFSYTEQF